jgi:hypothetical protein
MLSYLTGTLTGTLEADVVETIELHSGSGDPVTSVTIRTDGADIWVTLGQRAPHWAQAPTWSNSHRDRRLPADPVPDDPDAYLVTSEQPVTCRWLNDAFRPTVKLWSASGTGYTIDLGTGGRWVSDYDTAKQALARAR